MPPLDPPRAFDPRDGVPVDPVERRTFLKLMGASLALGGFTGCTRQPLETIVPYVRQPEDLVLGVPLYFATAMPLGGSAAGLLVESHEGRPTKVEGNPTHPASLGAADVFAQAAILSLYDPDRAQTITHLGEIQSWAEFLGAMRAAMAAQQPLKGAGVRILTESVSSPTLAAQIRDLLKRLPSAKWHQWDPLSRDNAKRGAQLAFGRYADVMYHLDRADVIVSLDSDFLCDGPAGLRYTREFSSRRRPEDPARMNRLYVVEGMPTSTGGRADHRLPRRPGMIPGVAEHLAAAVGAGGSATSSLGPLDPRATKWVTAVAKDLRAHRGSSVVIAGDTQPAEVHALAHAMNAALGNTGRTVVYTDSVEAEPVDHLESLRDLVADMRAGKVDILLIAGGNPVYSAPIDLGFADALGKVNLRAHLSLHADETSAQCHWHIPEAHFLESWSDARAFDGTASIVQPLIAPLYNGRTAHEFLAATTDRPEQSPYDIVRAYWKTQSRSQDFEADWRRWLHDGVIPNTAFAPINPGEPKRLAPQRTPQQSGATLSGSPRFEINFRLDPSVADGRFANNGWLQELPKPVTKLTWDNAVLVSPTTAQKLGATSTIDSTGGEHGQIDSALVELRYRGRTSRGLLFAVPGHPDDCATVHLGYGRERGGQVAHGAGFNAYVLRTSDGMWQGDGLEIVTTGLRGSLACTQFHHEMEGRRPVRATTRDEFVKNPRASVHEGDDTPARIITLYPDFKYEGYKWGMAIDVNSCIGCNACIVACQAENNIPVVGKEQVLKGREMHWLRVDEYHEGAPETPETYFQPVPCMHCENAPCEEVCPVGATVHSDEGLNDMVYNRCVGTRYCSNNCPYKVRRFNFLLYQDWNTPSLTLARNPDVSIRSRGVMEKCTYCVQRINRAKIDAEKEDRRVQDGEIKSACQQTCPADAIVFGDLNDPNSRVAKLQAEVRNYSLLGELNTRPRTTYLAAVRNPNPELEGL